MLEEYRKLRELVRETIPEDRDFYGKIEISDLDFKNEEEFRKSVRDRYGPNDIEVDMDLEDFSAEGHKRIHYEGEALQISSIPPIGKLTLVFLLTSTGFVIPF